MPLFYPLLEWKSNLLDPRGVYLNLNNKNYRNKLKEMKYTDDEGFTTEIMGKYILETFKKIEKNKYDEQHSMFGMNLRSIQIHNEFLFYAKKKLKCTNSYIKMWEILQYMSHNNYLPSGKFFAFFDAEFPGNFVKASIDFFESQSEIEFDWSASSLFPCEENTALDDIYGFYRDHPTKWLMNDKINGDVTSKETLEYQTVILQDKIDMYVCDLGIQHDESNFLIQERENISMQLCAIIKGMILLKSKGILLCKIYSCLESVTRKIVCLLVENFEDVIVCKPSSSRGRNKELYLLATNYKKKTSNQTLLHFFKNQTIDQEVDKEVYLMVSYISQFFAVRQITWLEKLTASFLEKDYHQYAEKYLQYLQLT